MYQLNDKIKSLWASVEVFFLSKHWFNPVNNQFMPLTHSPTALFPGIKLYIFCLAHPKM